MQAAVAMLKQQVLKTVILISLAIKPMSMHLLAPIEVTQKLLVLKIPASIQALELIA
ncbi:hypothetical protein PMIT1312_00672 [Prochlorococcus marinus str. MIT 1312]|nr:hypothetical protein PMIT1312_00672 [Prochlorococcus marinus str. MIT 1312]